MEILSNKKYSLKCNGPKVIRSHFGGTHMAQYWVTFAASLTLFIQGLIIGWTGPNLLILRSNTSPIPMTDNEMSWLPSSSSIGLLVASFFTTYFIDTVGCRKTLLISIIPSFAFFIFVYFATNIWILCISQFFGGVQAALAYVALQTYITEISSPEIRGKLGMYTGILSEMGVLIENFVVPRISFYTNALICSILCVMFGLIVWFIPISPYYSIMCGNEIQAEKTLKYLRQTKDVALELDQLKTGWALEQKEEKCSLIDLIKIKHVRYCLWIVFGVDLVLQLAGDFPVYAFLQVTLEKAHPPISVSTYAIMSNILLPTWYFLTAPLLDIWGRRIIFIISTLGCALGLTINGIFFSLQSANYIHISNLTLMPVFGYSIFILAISVGLEGLVSIYTGELFAVQFRAKAGAVVTIFGSALAFCATNLYAAIEEHFGTQYCFYTFASFSAMGTIFGLIFLPETKMKSLEQIQLDLRKNNYCEDYEIGLS